ncbi:hypothetical protein LTR09_010623 [Extremus antarcticus]|uniref:Uncharacterized protein n=1 Tax=Extremus antarcticus TaxID=702011 RepID=A0AAJ0D7C3_9PEZI|nr:hypothetical protein LTR09_010623 [Extremus antarcticus]
MAQNNSNNSNGFKKAQDTTTKDIELRHFPPLENAKGFLYLAVSAFRRAGKEFAVKIYEPLLHKTLQGDNQEKIELDAWATQTLHICPAHEDSLLVDKMVKQAIELLWSEDTELAKDWEAAEKEYKEDRTKVPWRRS